MGRDLATTDRDRVMGVVQVEHPVELVVIWGVQVAIDPTITTEVHHKIVVRATTHSPPAASLVHTLTNLNLPPSQVENGRNIYIYHSSLCERKVSGTCTVFLNLRIRAVHLKS